MTEIGRRPLGPKDWAAQLARLDVLDIHHHLGSRARLTSAHAGASAGLGAYSLGADHAMRIHMMDMHAIATACVLPASALPPATAPATGARMLNEQVAEYCRADPVRFPVGLATLALADLEASLAELERVSGVPELRGIVWHHRLQGAFIDHPAMQPLLKRMQELELPAFVHTIAESGMEAFWRLEEIAAAFPDLPFVALDAFSGPGQSHWALSVARRRPNILLETGALISVGHTLDRCIGELGDERIIFGSDFYAHPPTYFHPAALYEILAAPWPEATKAKLLGGNARRLLRLAGPESRDAGQP